MASSSPESEPYCLTPLDNIIGTRYVQKALFFPAVSSDVSSIMQNMTFGLAQTFTVIPFLAGTVTRLPDGIKKGRLAVTAPWRTPEDAIKFKDLRKTDYPSYGTLRSKHFPMGDVDYNILMPKLRSIHLPDAKPLKIDDRPVLLAQINVIEGGGMILGLVLDHSFTDGVGVITVARVWAAYCRGEDGSQLFSHDLIDRTRLMEGYEGVDIEDVEDYVYSPEPKAVAPTHGFLSGIFTSFRSLVNFKIGAMEPLRAILRVGSSGETLRATLPVGSSGKTLQSKPDLVAVEMFFFQKVKLQELKEMASRLESDETSWISTHDALTSLLWCCVTAAQKTDIAKRFESIDNETTSGKSQVGENSALLGFFVQARRFARPPLPEDFIGNVLMWGSIIEPFSTVVPTVKGITECAHSLRRKLRQYDDTNLPHLIGAINSVPDMSRVRIKGFDKRSLMVNSWACLEWYDLDWGKMMGRCERVRINRLKLGNFCLVLPELKGCEGKEGEAGLEVMISLKSHYMKMLMENELFNRFAEWRCS